MPRNGSESSTRLRQQLLVVVVAFACGCGGGQHGESRDGQPDPAAAPAEVMLSAAQLYGEPSLAGHITTKPVVLRRTGDTLQVLDLGKGAAPEAFGAVPVFSSVTTAWAIGRSRDDPAPSLLRSDDLGGSWHVVADLPMPELSARSLHVERDAEGLLTAWVAFEENAGFFAVGPRIFARPVDGGAPWAEVAGIPSGAPLRIAVLARRGGNLELLRQTYEAFGGDGRIAIDAISDHAALPLRTLDQPFLADDYATFQDCGWIAGVVGEPAVLSACGADDWNVHVLPGIGAGVPSHAIDFADANHGVVCGDDVLRNSFCFFTVDGGASWSRSETPPNRPLFGVTDVALGPDGRGIATFGGGGLGTTLLATGDGGATWQELALPPLARRVRLGHMARRSQAPDWSAAPDAPSALPSPVAPPAPASFPAPAVSGPRAWAIGDSGDRGPTITALLLRSDDAGRTWHDVLSVPGGSFSGAAFVDRRNGWVVGAGRVFHTADGGASFVEQTEAARTSDASSRPVRVTAADADRAVLTVGGELDDVLLFTTDGGATWAPSRIAARPSGGNRIEGGVCLTRAGLGVAVRYTDVLLTADGGASWIPGPSFDFHIEDEGFSVSGSGFTGPLVACSGDADLWILVAATDPRGETLWHSPDGGTTWRNLTAAIGRTPQIGPTVGGFASERNAVVVVPYLSEERFEEQLALLRTRDGGNSWLEISTPLTSGRDVLTGERPEAIAFADASRAMMLTTVLDYTRPGSVRHSALTTLDGGDTWGRSELPPDFHPLGLCFVP